MREDLCICVVKTMYTCIYKSPLYYMDSYTLRIGSSSSGGFGLNILMNDDGEVMM